MQQPRRQGANRDMDPALALGLNMPETSSDLRIRIWLEDMAKLSFFYCEEVGLVVTDFGGDSADSVPKGGFLRGRLRPSSVTPFPSFVTPTTGGSPFLTNSQRPKGTCISTYI